jgi:hypothetical protein
MANQWAPIRRRAEHRCRSESVEDAVDNVVTNADARRLRRPGDAAARGGLLTAEGARDGRVEVIPPCCDLAVGDFEDTHDRHRYLDTVLTA